MQDAVISILVIVFVVVVIILVIVAVNAVVSGPAARPSRPTVIRLPQSPRNAPPIEGIVGLVALGVVGLATYKFIQSGGLRRLNAEIGKLPVNVHGQRKSIAAAIQEDSYVEELLKSAIEKKMREVFDGGKAIETLDIGRPKAAADVAQMLQEAIEARMRRDGIN